MQKACTSAHGVVVAAAAPELLTETCSRLIEKRQGKSIILDEDTMPRAASFGPRPSEHMHPCIENPTMMLDCGPWGCAFGRVVVFGGLLVT